MNATLNQSNDRYLLNNKYSNNEPEWNNLLLGSLLIAISLTTIFGNLLVICAVIRERILKTATNYYIISLAVADLLVGLVVMPFNSLNEMTNNYWFFGEIWCDLWHSLDVFASTASILSLLMIALDRHSAISDPINYPTRWLNCNWFHFVAGIWICSAFISFPAIGYWRWIKTDYIPNQCIFTDDVYYLVFSSLVSFYVPLTLMIIVYIRIYRAATKQVNAIKTGQKLNVKGTNGQAVTLRIHRGGYHGIKKTEQQKSIKAVPSNTKLLNTLRKSYSLNDLTHPKKLNLTKFKSLTNLKRKTEINTNPPRNTTAQSNLKTSTNHLVNMMIMNTSTPRLLNSPHSLSASVANSVFSLNNRSVKLTSAATNKNYEEYRQTIDFYQQHYVEHQAKLVKTISSKRRKCSNCIKKTNISNNKLIKSENCCLEFKKTLINKINSLSLTRKMSKFSREQKAAKTLGIVMGVFIICWMPFFLYQTLAIGIFHKPSNTKSHNLYFTIFTWFGYANSGCNPIIYAFSSRDFRRAFYKILFSSRLAKSILNLFSKSKGNISRLKQANKSLVSSSSRASSSSNSINQCQVCHLYKQIILANNINNLNKKTLLLLVNEKNKYLETNATKIETTKNVFSKISESYQELNKKTTHKNSSASLSQSLRRRVQILFNTSTINTNPTTNSTTTPSNNINNRRIKQSIQLKRTPSIDSVSSGVSLVLKSKPSNSNFSKEYKFDRQKSKLILLNEDISRSSDLTKSLQQRIPIGTRFSFVNSNEKNNISNNSNGSGNFTSKRQFKQVYSFKQPNKTSNGTTTYLLTEQLSVNSNSKSQYCSFDDETYTDRIYND